MAKMVRTTQAALAKARARRVALDAARDERDRRVESAAAEVFVLLGERGAAQTQLAVAEVATGAALRSLLEDGLSIAAVGELVELAPSEIRRLTKLARPASRADAEDNVDRVPRR